MSLAQLTADLGHFVPELVLTGIILVLTLYDLFLKPEHSHRVGYAALGGLVITMLTLLTVDTSESRGLFANMLALDGFGLYFKWLVSLGSLFVVWISLNSNELKNRKMGEYYILTMVLTLGMFFLVSATHLLSIYLALEMVSLMSYVLAGYLKENMRSNESSVKYVIYGAVSSGVLLYGFSLLYGLTGSANISEIQVLLAGSNIAPALLLLVMVLVLVGFGYKIAAVPFHFWTPDVYEGAPAPITAYLSVAPKAAGFAVLIRFLNVVFTGEGNPNAESWAVLSSLNWPIIIGGLAAITMTVGNVLAIQQANIKRMLAYSSIAHAGYMLMGLVVADQTGLSAVLYYSAVYMLMNLGAFFVAIHIKNAFDTETIEEYQGLGYQAPYLGVAMAVFMFSLTGIPPTGGFVAKFYLFRALIEYGDQHFWLAIVGLINSVIALYYYMRVVKAMYLSKVELVENFHVAPLNLNILLGILMVPLILGWMVGDPLSSLAEAAMHFFVH
jgi:NADH-quinone oxidoreductase subunit N